MVGIPGRICRTKQLTSAKNVHSTFKNESHFAVQVQFGPGTHSPPLISFIDKHWHPCSVLPLAVVVCILAPYLLLKDEGIER